MDSKRGCGPRGACGGPNHCAIGRTRGLRPTGFSSDLVYQPDIKKPRRAGLFYVWRRERDCAARPCAAPLRPACAGLRGRALRARPKSLPAILSNQRLLIGLVFQPDIKKAPVGAFFMSGGERGIRTLDTLLTYTPLAGERFRPLSHLSENRA